MNIINVIIIIMIYYFNNFLFSFFILLLFIYFSFVYFILFLTCYFILFLSGYFILFLISNILFIILNYFIHYFFLLANMELLFYSQIFHIHKYTSPADMPRNRTILANPKTSKIALPIMGNQSSNVLQKTHLKLTLTTITCYWYRLKPKQPKKEIHNLNIKRENYTKLKFTSRGLN